MTTLIGSTMPGDGSEVHKAHAHPHSDDPNVRVVEVPGEKISFRDQTIGACSHRAKQREPLIAFTFPGHAKVCS
jgi:hypothetical protein